MNCEAFFCYYCSHNVHIVFDNVHSDMDIVFEFCIFAQFKKKQYLRSRFRNESKSRGGRNLPIPTKNRRSELVELRSNSIHYLIKALNGLTTGVFTKQHLKWAIVINPFGFGSNEP